MIKLERSSLINEGSWVDIYSEISVLWRFKSSRVLCYEESCSKMLDPESDKCFWTKCTLSDKELGSCFGYKNFKYIEPDGYESI